MILVDGHLLICQTPLYYSQIARQSAFSRAVHSLRRSLRESNNKVGYEKTGYVRSSNPDAEACSSHDVSSKPPRGHDDLIYNPWACQGLPKLIGAEHKRTDSKLDDSGEDDDFEKVNISDFNEEGLGRLHLRGGGDRYKPPRQSDDSGIRVIRRSADSTPRNSVEDQDNRMRDRRPDVSDRRSDERTPLLGGPTRRLPITESRFRQGLPDREAVLQAGKDIWDKCSYLIKAAPHAVGQRVEEIKQSEAWEAFTDCGSFLQVGKDIWNAATSSVSGATF